MSRFFLTLVFWVFLAVPGMAQTAAGASDALSGLARPVAADSGLSDVRRGGMELRLSLSQGVPFRAYTLGDPWRLVLDFQEVDWTGFDAAAFVRSARPVALRTGTIRPGWSRMVATLPEPLRLRSVDMRVKDPNDGGAELKIALERTDNAQFLAESGAPFNPRWAVPPLADLPPRPEKGPDAPLVVVLDPGHGGIDPGAERGGVNEKTLMLSFARELREALLRAGRYEVHFTRDSDVFVSLERRIAIAQALNADVFLSLHADSLAEGLAHGATVHVLSDQASDAASAALAERHNRTDLLSGADLSASDDVVAGIMLDLARQETQPRTEALAMALVKGMDRAGGPMNKRPLRRAGFSVLKSANIPSVLIEIGFLSSPRDLENLRNPAWRAGMAAGIRDGLETWRRSDALRGSFVRQ